MALKHTRYRILSSTFKRSQPTWRRDTVTWAG